MYPTTPTSIDTIDSETQSEHTIEGMRTRAIRIITNAVTSTHWIVCGLMARYCNRSNRN